MDDLQGSFEHYLAEPVDNGYPIRILIRTTAILGTAVTSQHGALLSDDIVPLKTSRLYALPCDGEQ